MTKEMDDSQKNQQSDKMWDDLKAREFERLRMSKEQRIRQTHRILHSRIAQELNLPPAHKMLVNEAYRAFCEEYEASKAGSDDWKTFAEEALRFVPDRLEIYGITMPMRRSSIIHKNELIEKETYEHLLEDGHTKMAIEFKRAFDEDLMHQLEHNSPPVTE